MRSNLSTEKKLNTLVKKSVDLKPLQILGWKGIKSKNTAILTLKYPSWEQKVRRPRVKKSGDKKSGKTSNLQGKLVFVQKWGRRTFSMEIGWFWGEIRVLWWRQLINTAVGHYLWGIDTFAVSSICREKAFPSDITYEELIQDLYLFLQIQHLQWSRTLPMRNWYDSDVDGVSTSSSDITYEELIHFLSKHQYIELRLLVGHYLWGIDTTHSFLPWCFLPMRRSDITYEELIREVLQWKHFQL